MHIIPRLPLLLILLPLLLFQGCAPEVSKKDQQAEINFQLQLAALMDAGDYTSAAKMLESKAQLSASPTRERLLLKAAEVWSKAGEWDETERLLQSLEPARIPEELSQRHRMLLAELAIHRGDLDRALDLMQPPPGPDSPLELRQRQHKNMAEIFRLNGNLLESARELSELDSLLLEPEEKLSNQVVLVQTLSTMTDTALALLQPDPPGVLGGWMDLVRIFKRQSEDPTNFEPRLAAWRETFPDHPALPELLSGYFEQQTIDQSSHIAVLLPRTGPYAKVANAVRDGFMAAWYQRPPESRPALRFYDSSAPEQIIELYQKALAQGAQMMIGPLNKAALTQLVEVGDLAVPTLALNQVDSFAPPPRMLFQFGLAPEDEAKQVAEMAWLEGHSRTLALTPRDDWGERIYRSFRSRWESLGGTILEHQTYDQKENDFSRPIRSLLNVDESQARKQSLQQIIGVPMESEPRRRSDAQMIFLAARPQKARQLRPQLKFYHAGDLPLFSTSHIYSSLADTEKDKDLGQLRFVDTPWLLENNSDSQLSRARLAKLMPGVGGSYARLYALGIDAFNLLPHLQPMRDQPGRSLSGKSGNLYLDSYNRVHRQLAWAEMSHGKARITGYAPRLEKPETDRSQQGASLRSPLPGNPTPTIVSPPAR